MENYKNLYDYLLESEELYIMFQDMRGDWEKDKKKFIEAQEELQNLANTQIIDLDDQYEEEYPY